MIEFGRIELLLCHEVVTQRKNIATLWHEFVSLQKKSGDRTVIFTATPQEVKSKDCH
jgi:hypothetical protein